MLLDRISKMSGLEVLVWALFIGCVLGAFMIFYQKRVIGAFVRKLLSAGADSPDNAKMISEIGFAKNPFVRSELRRSGTLRRIVWEVDDNMQTSAEGVTFSAREKPLDPESARFFIPEENRIRAELRYSEKGTDVYTIVLMVILFLAIAYAALFVVPYIQNLLSELKAGA